MRLGEEYQCQFVYGTRTLLDWKFLQIFPCQLIEGFPDRGQFREIDNFEIRFASETSGDGLTING